jgi:hypothetical protein
MHRGVLDTELPHRNASFLPPVQLLGQLEMFENDGSLAMQRRGWWQWSAMKDGLALLEDPWVSDASACNRYAVYPSFLHHSQASVGRKQIAAT